MTKSHLRTYLFMFTLATIFMLAHPVGLSAQWRIGRKDNKQNKPPDRNEFQLPSNGSFKADPTFFSARSDDERCNAIDLWLSSIRYEASQSRKYKSNRYYWANGELDMNRVEFVDVLQFSVPAFKDIFGKSLPEFSEKETKEVAKSLDKCSYQPWVEAYLENLFKNRAVLQQWATAFEGMEQAYQNEKLAQERQLYRERYREESKRTGYSVGELIKETELYRLHAAFLGDYENWCAPRDGRAIVSLIFKADENFQIDNNQQYWNRFENEILPAISSRCGGVDRIYVVHYVQGFYVNLDQRQVSRQIDPSHPSDVLNIAVYSANPPDARKYDWVYGNGTINILNNVVRPGRRAGGRRDYSTDGLTNDSRLTSISRLRDIFRIREAEEQARKERLAGEEQARKAEEQRQAEINRRENIARKLESHRVKAAPVLRLYKKGAPAKFNFSGYEQQEVLQNIYAGDFEQFTGGYDSEFLDNADAKNAALMLGCMMGNGTSCAQQTKMMAVARRRVLIRLAYLAYHQEYAEQCSSNTELRWEDPVPRRRSVNLPVREPFSNSYLSIFEAMGQGEEVVLGGLPSDTKQAFRRDFRKLLNAQGCSSSAVRHFEINLYLATEWLLPLQELQPSLATGNSGLQPERTIPKTQQAKTRIRGSNQRSTVVPQRSKTPAKSETQVAAPKNQSATMLAASQEFKIGDRLLTDLQVRRGDKVTITASGRITVGAFAGSATPNGISGFQDYSVVYKFPHGSLLVRVRQYQGDEWTFCGSSCSFTAERDGYLDFIVNDNDSANNSGTFQIQVQVDRSRMK